MSGGYLPVALTGLYTEIMPSNRSMFGMRQEISLRSQVIDISAFPAESLRLREAQMSQHATGELAGHLI